MVLVRAVCGIPHGISWACANFRTVGAGFWLNGVRRHRNFNFNQGQNPAGIRHTTRPDTCLPMTPAHAFPLFQRLQDGHGVRRMLWAALALLPLWLGALSGYQFSERAGLSQLAAVANERLELYAATLEAELARFVYLPSLVAAEPDVAALLAQPGQAGLREQAARKLVRIGARAGANRILVLSADHNVLASSAGDLALPPGLAQALAQGPQDFFAANDFDGSTDYYFVHPVQQKGQLLGRVVVRVNLAPLEATWIDLGLRSQSERLLVVDENEVVVISSIPAWKYKTMLPGVGVSAGGAGRKPSGRYAAASLAPLDLRVQKSLEPGVNWVSLPAQEGAKALSFVAQERPIVPLGARLMALSDPSDVQRQARLAAWGGGAAGALLSLVFLHGLHRRRALRQLLQARNALQQAHDQLEVQVDERTWQLRAANDQLKNQIAQREQAESGLMQAGKLTVLGQMSAGISHEINQPLTALRALSRNALQLLDIGRQKDVASNLRHIDEMAERMGRIVNQLKSFARKETLSHQPVELAQALRNVLLMLSHRLKMQQGQAVALQVEVPAGLRVVADLHRLEQVLLNLAGNALDAMEGLAPGQPRRLHISASPQAQRVSVRVQDSGPGLDEAQWQRLFEPFFTTKPAGQGLGLGLLISSKIVAEFGGSLRASRPPEGGMLFEFDLARAEDADV